MKKITLLLLSLFFTAIGFAQLNMTYVGDIEYTLELNDVWGYVAPDGTEYAIVGLENGTSVVSLADPTNPTEVGFVPGPSTIWRDIKVWGDFAYVTNESSGGLHVIDLSGLPDNVSAEFWAPSLSTGGTLSSCHNIWIDEFGVAYLAGCNVNNGGLIYADVATDPGNPIYLGAAPAVYSHDVYVRNNLAYSSEIGVGVFTVYDATDKTNTVALGSQATELTNTHNAWLSDDSNILFTTDETGNGPVGSYDVSDPTDIKVLDQFRPLETLGDGVVPHNVHVWDDFLIVSYYTDGCILVDASRPSNLIEVGNFDTYIPANTGFDGAWGAYPYLPSGLVLVSDIGNGLIVLEPNYVRACYLEGKVTDEATGAAIFGATVDILTDLAFGETGLDGRYATGLAISGTYEVKVSKPGYESKTVTVDLDNGELTELDVELGQLPSFALSGSVIDAETGEGVPNAKIQLTNDDFFYNLTTDANGDFNLSLFYQGTYEVIADKWGYQASQLSAIDFDELNNSFQIEIEKGIEDIFSFDLGWTISGDAPQGQFELGNPVGVLPDQFPTLIQPEDDVVEDIGNSCYVTGNIPAVEAGIQVTGTVKITSPEFDLSEMNDPRINFHYWLFTVNATTFLTGDDNLVVKLMSGTESVTVAEFSSDIAIAPSWIPSEIIVKDHFPEPTADMRISFELGDFDPGIIDAAEVAIDYFHAFDADPPSSLANQFDENISLAISPNPTVGEFTLSYDLQAAPAGAKLLVYNTLGQTVMERNLLSQSGTELLGDEFERGMYLVKIEQDGLSSRAVRVVKQ